MLRVNVSSANIRSGPGVEYEGIDIAFEDDEFEVVARTNNASWYIIELPNGNEAWIAASVAEPQGFTADDIEVAVTIPAPLVVEGNNNNPPPTTSNPSLTDVPVEVLVEPTFTSAPVAICDCSGDRYNCSSFSSSYQANQCFNYCISIGAGDIHRLDRDNDGRVCEG